MQCECDTGILTAHVSFFRSGEQRRDASGIRTRVLGTLRSQDCDNVSIMWTPSPGTVRVNDSLKKEAAENYLFIIPLKPKPCSDANTPGYL